MTDPSRNYNNKNSMAKRGGGRGGGGGLKWLDIEDLVHCYEYCQSVRYRLHLDFACPFLRKMFLILIDTHFKWIEAAVTPSTSSTCVIEEL